MNSAGTARPDAKDQASPIEKQSGAQSALPPWLAWASRVVTDRRWAAPLSACALGLGLFIGVAVGPGAAGGLASGAGQIIRLPAALFGSGGGDTADTSGGGGSNAPLAALGSPVGNSQTPAPAAPVAPPVSPVPFPSATPSVPSSGPAPTPPEPPARPKQQHNPTPPKHEPPPKQQTLRGVVVHVNAAAHSYTVAASGGGDLNAVHASTLPEPGTKVKVPVRPLFNGTYAEDGDRSAKGRAESAELTGIVTFRDPTTDSYTVSKRGISTLVRVRPDGSDSQVPPPDLGSYVDVEVEIESAPAQRARRLRPGKLIGALTRLLAADRKKPGTATARAGDAPQDCTPDASPDPPPEIEPGASLWQSSIEVKDQFTYSDFEGIVISCPETRKLVLSADDIREGGQDLTFTAVKRIDLSKLTIGDSVDVTATIGEGGSLSLSGVVSDEGAAGANDSSSGQGDLAG